MHFKRYDEYTWNPVCLEQLSVLTQILFFFLIQKDQKNVEAPFYYLANEFYKLYNERVEVTKSLVI